MKDELARVLGGDVSIENLRLLTGGASRSTYAFDAVTGSTRRPLILRTAPPAEHYAGMELEAAAQAAAARAGAPVPHVLMASDSPAALGDPFLICDEVAGETIVRRIQRKLDDAGRKRLLVQCAQALAAIHRADTGLPGLAERDHLAEYRQRLDDMGDTTATFEWALRWLAANRPAASAKVLVHGDFRMGNLIVDCPGPTLAAVLDWELVQIGDPYYDLAWFCVRAWRFGAPAGLAAGGLGSIDEFVSAYENAGGAAVDRGTLHWWLVLCTLHWGVICRYQAERHLSGQTRSVELAAIGRRVCENEWDILDLVVESTMPPRDEAEQERDDQGRGGVMSEAYGRPTAAELVAAVAEFLDTDVRANTTGAVNFHALVAANALRIVERELLDDSDPPGLLDFPDEAALAAAIRSGELDGREQELLKCLRAVVARRLAISHPGYDEGR